jgi:hypothetical protein
MGDTTTSGLAARHFAFPVLVHVQRCRPVTSAGEYLKYMYLKYVFKIPKCILYLYLKYRNRKVGYFVFYLKYFLTSILYFLYTQNTNYTQLFCNFNLLNLLQGHGHRISGGIPNS